MRSLVLPAFGLNVLFGGFLLSAQTVTVDNFVGLPNGGATTWGLASNWSLGRPPTANETASIVFDDSQSRTIVFDQSTIGGFLGVVNAGGGQLTLVEPAGQDLTFNTESFGLQTHIQNPLYTANFVQTGGTNSASEVNVGGINTEFYGGATYSIGGGTLLAQSLDIGQLNTGVFNQTGGAVSVAGMSLGELLDGNGTYHLSGGTFHAGGVAIGDEVDAAGTFDQSGGTSLIDGTLFLSGGDGNGTYLLSSNSAALHAHDEYLGNHGFGFFGQSAGTNIVDGALIVGDVESGKYQMSGGTLSAGTLIISQFFGGQFAQTAGSVTVGSPTALGLFNENGGTYSMSGASSSLMVNGYGTINGAVQQSAGTIFFTGDATLTSSSRYVMSGGTLHTNSEFAGGTFNQSGGLHSVNAQLTVGTFANYTLSGGSLSTNNFLLWPGGKFNWSGGTLSAQRMVIYGTMTLTPGHNKTLITPSINVVGGGGAEVDLTDNSLIIPYMSPTPSGVFEFLRVPLQDGALTSSLATSTLRLGYADDALAHRTTFGNQMLTSTSEVLVGLTYAGDANMDGKVDIADLGLLASHYGSQNSFWQDGDFDYNGTVDITDLSLLASNWGAGTTNPGSLSADLAALGMPAVPEPIGLGSLFAAALLLRRRAS